MTCWLLEPWAYSNPKAITMIPTPSPFRMVSSPTVARKGLIRLAYEYRLRAAKPKLLRALKPARTTSEAPVPLALAVLSGPVHKAQALLALTGNHSRTGPTRVLHGFKPVCRPRPPVRVHSHKLNMPICQKTVEKMPLLGGVPRNPVLAEPVFGVHTHIRLSLVPAGSRVLSLYEKPPVAVHTSRAFSDKPLLTQTGRKVDPGSGALLPREKVGVISTGTAGPGVLRLSTLHHHRQLACMGMWIDTADVSCPVLTQEQPQPRLPSTVLHRRKRAPPPPLPPLAATYALHTVQMSMDLPLFSIQSVPRPPTLSRPLRRATLGCGHHVAAASVPPPLHSNPRFLFACLTLPLLELQTALHANSRLLRPLQEPAPQPTARVEPQTMTAPPPAPAPPLPVPPLAPVQLSSREARAAFRQVRTRTGRRPRQRRMRR